MPADSPTILATSGGYVMGPYQAPRVGPILRYAAELSGASQPKVCVVNTAGGDSERWLGWSYAAIAAAGWTPTHLQVYPMPNVPDPTEHLLSCDVVWVGGGSVANLLALWRLHGYDRALRTAWENKVVLGGVSAGSLCWHAGGTTDSFTYELTPITNGLGFLPYSNCPHYDSESRRRPLFQSLVADGTLPDGYATDDGAGLLYRGTDLVEAVCDRENSYGWQVRRGDDGAVETRLETRRLPA
ncbi:MAG: Type 1 glutamine amidotransferase-like domain-containing protein [Mycobacteriales bacterium]